MPKRRDNLRFQTTPGTLVGRSEFDPESNETYEDELENVKELSAQHAGFESQEQERLDVRSRTLIEAEQVVLRGEKPINSPNANMDASRTRVSAQKQAEKQIVNLQNALIASTTTTPSNQDLMQRGTATDDARRAVGNRKEAPPPSSPESSTSTPSEPDLLQGT